MEKRTGASREAIQHHYDVGSDFFRVWLDEHLNYSAGRWRSPDAFIRKTQSLLGAQIAKLDYHLHWALQGKVGCRILDVGCGWGAAMRRAVEHYGVSKACGLTLSADQSAHISKWADARYDVRLMSWEKAEFAAPFDGIVSIGAFEHFAKPNIPRSKKLEGYSAFFDRAHKWLKADGRLTIQTVCWGGRGDDPSANIPSDIFPETDVPHVWDIIEASHDRFEVMRLENRRSDYIQTLRAWHSNFRRNEEFIKQHYGEAIWDRYHRMMVGSLLHFKEKRYYLVRVSFTRI